MNLTVTSATINTISLEWVFQMNGSSPRSGVAVEIRRNGGLERTDMFSPEIFTATVSNLLPLTMYDFHTFVVSSVGRSRLSAVNSSTLSLRMSLYI